jgi:hypothetical protein
MKNKQKNAERRSSRRFAISLPITYNITIPPFKKQVKIRTIAKDVNARGIGFVVSNKPASSVMNLQIGFSPKAKSVESTKSKFIKVKARIVYSQPISKEHKDIFRTGVCFVELGKNDVVLLRELLDRYKKR